jgi:hypothetical protein
MTHPQMTQITQTLGNPQMTQITQMDSEGTSGWKAADRRAAAQRPLV